MMNLHKYILPTLFSLALLASCNLEKEIDLELPEYSNQPVVECYLEPGQPFRLLLSQSASFFAPFDTNLVNFLDNISIKGADVNIRYDGNTIHLEEGTYVDPVNFKVYNYASDQVVPDDFPGSFELEIILQDGEFISGTTSILPVVAIDSVVIQFPNTGNPRDTLARVLTYLTDPDMGVENFFRRHLHWNSLRDSIPYQDFISSDDFSDNELVTFGTGFEFPEGDSVINTIYHISPEYFNYLESVFTAIQANGTPFGQPSTIVSNVEGNAEPLGIFTGLNYDRVTTIIKK
jgi:hypothetical protein